MATMSSPLRPFSPESRTGFELELVAPVGLGRIDLAHALARRFGGDVEYGLKYHSDAVHRDGRPVCHLTPAYRVSRGSKPVVTIVDDNTINRDLDGRAPPGPGQFRLVVDDVRIALWLERNSFTRSTEPDACFEKLVTTFDGEVRTQGAPPAQHPEHRVIVDPLGHALAVVALYGGQRDRVAEVVTAPLLRHERLEVLSTILGAAKELGFFCPYEGALHLHLDRGPWMSTRRLRQLVLDFGAEREALRAALEPNAACTKLGPFPERVVEVARSASADADFDAFRRELRQAGVTKHIDLNVLGVVVDPPRHPTLEFRCLPMTMDLDRIDRLVTRVESFLAEVALRADDGVAMLPRSMEGSGCPPLRVQVDLEVRRADSEM